MNDNEKLDRDIERAAICYKKSDSGRWAATYFAARIVGKYKIGGTKALANRMGVSPDTVENLAHAYELYAEFRSEPHYRKVIRSIRLLPYIYYSYFRALYKARIDYKLTIDQVYAILMDVVLAEGDLSQRDLDVHIQDRFGDTRDWTYFGQRAQKEIHKTLQQPDLPKSVKDVLILAYNALGDKS